MRRKRATTAAAACAILILGCDTQRDRPTGPVAALPSTNVAVIAPQRDAVVGADSVVDVVVSARGAIDAVEYFATRIGLPDTVGKERRDFDPGREAVEVTFQFRVPGRLPTGVNLEIRGVAEDALGERYVSEPTSVIVIDCDQFPFACGGGP